MQLKFILFFFISVLFQYNSSFAQRIGNYDEQWKSISTEHFDVIVSAEQHDLGLYYAHAAEKAYQNLSTVFGDANSQDKIVLILNDTTDVANGYATVLPYPHIMAYIVPVNEHNSLSEAGEWSRELITHELTHIMQLRPANGFYKYLRPIFGNIIAPNMLTPSWWKEGMSVEMETQFSPRGRLRSVFQDTTIRSIIADNKLSEHTLPRANEILPSWPYGTRPYLFGSLFFSQLNFDTGLKSSGVLADRQGERVPYFIEEPMFEITGQSYEMQYDFTLHKAESYSLSQIDKLKTLPFSESEEVAPDSEASLYPRYSSQYNYLAYVENSEGKNTLVILDENQHKLNLKNSPTGEFDGIDFHPTEKKVLFSKVDLINSKYNFSDLYLYDIEQDKLERLTSAQRARNAAFSASGKQAVFITTFSGKTQVRTIDINTKNVKFIIDSGYENRYESPIFWDDETLLVSKSDANGIYRLMKIDLNTLTESLVPLNYPQLRFLKKHKNSLYFISSKNGVNNLYVSQDLKTAKPVSHILSGIWSYDINPDETQAWVSLLSSTGFRISKVKISPIATELPIIENNIENRYHFKDSEYTYKPLTTSEYEASSYLLPSYWIPFIATSSTSKGIFFQAQTSGFDPIKQHQYTLVASYDSEINRGNFSGIYTNSTQKIPFQISSIVQSRFLGTSNNIVQTSTHSFSLIPDMFEINKNLALQFGAHLLDITYATNTQHWGPFIQVAYKNFEQNIFQISPEKGWAGLIQFEKNYKLKDETNTIAKDYEKMLLSWVGFASPWLPKHHALKAKVSALITFSEVAGRYGSSNSSSFLFAEDDSIIPQFVTRGYANSQFFGRSLWNANLEYRFPISNIEKGYGTDPYFFKRLSGALIADGIGVEGSGLTENLTFQSLKLNESFWNTGIELKLESTIGYVLPMNFILGLYIPHSPLYASSSQLGLTLQIGGF